MAGSEHAAKELREKLAAQSSRHVEAAPGLQSERDAAQARAGELEQRLAAQAARVAEVEGQLSAQAAADADVAAELQVGALWFRS